MKLRSEVMIDELRVMTVRTDAVGLVVIIIRFWCRRKKGYSLRQYSPFVVAAVPMNADSGSEQRTAAFRSLAAYLFGGNQTETKMQMTTPVFSSPESMQFVLPVDMTADAPSPQADSQVQLQKVWLCKLLISDNFVHLGLPCLRQEPCTALCPAPHTDFNIRGLCRKEISCTQFCGFLERWIMMCVCSAVTSWWLQWKEMVSSHIGTVPEILHSYVHNTMIQE